MKLKAPKSPNSPNKYFGLQGKFLLGLAAIMLCFSAFSAGLIYFYEKNTLEDEAFRQTELVMTAVDATRAYVRQILRPKMYDELGSDDFVVEAMSSSFVSRAVMDYFKQELPEFEYRRVAINARNPSYEANEKEIEFVEYFRANPGVKEWRGIVETEKGRYFMRYKPVQFTSTCNRCHGKPHKAPQAIVNRYGSRRGFYRKIGEIGGIVSIGIPVEVGFSKIKEVALSVFSTTILSVFFLSLTPVRKNRTRSLQKKRKARK